MDKNITDRFVVCPTVFIVSHGNSKPGFDKNINP